MSGKTAIIKEIENTGATCTERFTPPVLPCADVPREDPSAKAHFNEALDLLMHERCLSPYIYHPKGGDDKRFSVEYNGPYFSVRSGAAIVLGDTSYDLALIGELGGVIDVFGSREVHLVFPELVARSLNLSEPRASKVLAACDTIWENKDRIVDLRAGTGDVFSTDPRTGDKVYMGPAEPDLVDALLGAQLRVLATDIAWVLIDAPEKPPRFTSTRLDPAQTARALDLLSFGHERALAKAVPLVPRAPIDPVFMDYILRPKGNERAAGLSDAIANIKDVLHIWRRAMELYRASGGAGEHREPGRTGSKTNEAIEMSENGGALCSRLAEMGKVTGAAAMVDAYYDGVPLEDILA